mmetsp:Transcript_19795/g.32452  ORF Transcript_19795/g.32452 Transcript_19795/m.32452 type:complete len:279 (-) Transcript_19795:405-1241(-)
MRHAQFVIGPAGSGKSTYCNQIRLHGENARRMFHVINLDPAAEHFEYPVAADVRELVSLDDVTSELGYGPNGGLVYCMEYLIQNLEWLKEVVDDFGDEDYLVFDCPGQVELYWHIPVMPKLVQALQKWDYNVCAVCCIDSTFLTDASKFLAGTMFALSSMIALQLPHVNVLTKMDLISQEQKEELERYLDPDVNTIVADLNAKLPERFRALNEAMGTLVDDFSMVRFNPLDINDEESLEDLLLQIDLAIQWGEDKEPKEVRTPPDAEERQEQDNGDDD